MSFKKKKVPLLNNCTHLRLDIDLTLWYNLSACFDSLLLTEIVDYHGGTRNLADRLSDYADRLGAFSFWLSAPFFMCFRRFYEKSRNCNGKRQ